VTYRLPHGGFAFGALCMLLFASCMAPDGRSTETSDEPARADARPNIILVVTDDQPTGTLSVMPQTRRWVKRGGVKLSNAYVTTPVCCPSRASILSGRYAHNHQVKTNEDSFRLDQEATVQRALGEAGYRTAIFGKYLNKWRGDPPYFDEWATISGRHLYYEGTWNVNGTLVESSEYRTEFVADKAVQFIANSHSGDPNRPWFLFLAVDAPHSPYLAERKYEGASVPKWKPSPAVREKNRSDKPRYVRQSDARRRAWSVRARQLRTLMSVDDLMGDLSTTLRATGEHSNTFVIFLSDNGYTWGDHGLLGAPMSKGTPYTGSIRVPMLMAWPARWDGPAVDDRMVANIDIAPTVLDAAGTTMGRLDGHSVLDANWKRTVLLAEFWQKRGEQRSTVPNWTSIRTPSYQYVEYTRDRTVIAREYYKLRPDPWQLRNLLGDSKRANDPDVGRLGQLLRRARGCAGRECS
jgi:arylsulfatase A-like enzyme